MPGDTPFRELIRRVRAGDEAAADELMRNYALNIRVELRNKLRQMPQLHRVVDSVDVVQDAMLSFFVGVGLGKWQHLQTPADFMGLLRAIAEHKLLDHDRKEHRKKRDPARVEQGSADDRDLPDAEPTPSRYVAARELLQRCRERFTEAERWLVDQRTQRMEWDDIAAACADGGGPESPPAELRGKSPEALRKIRDRAVERVGRELELSGLDL